MVLKVVAAVFGRLGGFRLGSQRFEAPNLRRIPEKPLVSCLCVTENRHAFMPWLLWGYDRQLWNRRELVIVDSSDPPVVAPERPDVRVLHVPPGTSLGKKRNLALDAARGQVVAWFDDDDWQHPQRLSLLVPLLREYATRIGASFIGPSRSYFLDVRGHRCARYLMHRYAIFNGAVYYTDMVRHARFPEDLLRTEDTRWLSTLLRKRQGAALVNEHPNLFLWLCHAANVTNANHIRPLPLDANELIRDIGPAWADTPAQLAALRSRLEARPAQRPVRVQLAEAARERSSTSPLRPRVIHTDPDATAGSLARGVMLPRQHFPSQTAATRAEPDPPSVAIGRGKLSLYLAYPRGRPGPERTGYVAFSAGGSRYGWLDAVVAIAVHRKNEWRGSDYVGVFDGDAGEPADLSAVARTIDGRAARGDVYILGSSERMPLRRLLARCANGEALARHLLNRLSIRDPFVLDREIVALDSGWMARPEVFDDYVRRWLIPARTVLNGRRDPTLRNLLDRRGVQSRNGPAEVAPRLLLEVLPSLAFSREGRSVHALGVHRRAVK